MATKDETPKEVVVRNNESGGELKYSAKGTPKKSTLGHSFFGTLNSQGIAELQAKGYNVTHESDWVELLKNTFGLSDNAVGNRGPTWRTPEERKKFSVFVDGTEFKPALSQKVLEKLEEQEETPEQVEQEAPQQIEVVADTTPTKKYEQEDIALIKQYQEQGANDKDIQAALAEKYDESTAKMMMDVANGKNQEPEKHKVSFGNAPQMESPKPQQPQTPSIF